MSALGLITQQFSNASPPPVRGDEGDPGLFGKDGFSFGDLIDIINPLHHIPVLGTLYRKITSDEIDPAARVAGGALFGGPLGAGLAVVGTALENVLIDKEDPESEVAVAATRPEIIERAAQATVIPQPASKERIAGIDNTVQLRGGWIVNAAYAGKSSALFQWARDPGSEYRDQLHVDNRDHVRKVSVNI